MNFYGKINKKISSLFCCHKHTQAKYEMHVIFHDFFSSFILLNIYTYIFELCRFSLSTTDIYAMNFFGKFELQDFWYVRYSFLILLQGSFSLNVAPYKKHQHRNIYILVEQGKKKWGKGAILGNLIFAFKDKINIFQKNFEEERLRR